MKRLFLFASAATIAMASAAYAGPGKDNGGGGGGGHAAMQIQRGGGGGGHAAVQVQRGGGGGAAMRGGGGFAAPRMAVRGGGGGFAEPRMAAPRMAAPRMEARGGYAAPRIERQQRFAAAARPQRFAEPRIERQQRFAEAARPQRFERAQMRMAERQQVRVNHQAGTRMAARQQIRVDRQQAQARVAERQQMRANRIQQAHNLGAQRVQQAQNLRAQSVQQAQTRMAQQQVRANQQQQVAARQQLAMNNVNTRAATNNGVGYGVGGCPAGLASKGCMPPGQAATLGMAGATPVFTAQNAAVLRAANVDPINAELGTQILAPAVATAMIGAPVTTAPTILGMGLSPLPQPISYLYPATPDYYYQYAPGYIYQVDRSTSLIDALIPLLAGGYMPGSYLPTSYMASYVPDDYGYDDFYPASYGYDDLCNRYAYGVIYQVDCMTGFVENVIPTYAGGYGVGQMLPSAYSYYNVPYQYRTLYPESADYGYWYAPGAIYQYDPSSSLITSVAALLSPGFTVGQPLPVGYDVYNVPYAYRASYYDTPNAWYRYNNGYIYQVDPTTMLVTAIVASALT